jgi:2-amino-4-hydroxy-6-hydroxymethyldihydropteridine diphosphokinase
VTEDTPTAEESLPGVDPTNARSPGNLPEAVDLPDGQRSEAIVDTITEGLRPIRRAAFALGSNVGEREDNLQGAVDSMLATPGIHPHGLSPVYETSAMGGPEQPDYLNAVLVVDTTLSADALLERANAVEEAYGRDRSREERWGPRTLDIDLLALGDRAMDTPRLTLPHPRLHERSFVLVPWADVDPSFLVPGQGTVRELLSSVGAADVRRRVDVVLQLP